MGLIIKILRVLGVLNVTFVVFNGSYQFSSEYFDNTTIVIVLVILAAISFIKDIFDFVGVTVEKKPLNYFFRLVTIVTTGILSSLVILIPKLLFIESHSLDSMHVKFTTRITRVWSKEELTLYLENLISIRGVNHLISDTDQILLVETSSSMGSLRESFNALVTERLDSLKPEVTEAIETITVVSDPSWMSENPLLVAAAITAGLIVVCGIAYFTYTHLSATPSPNSAVNDVLSRNNEIREAMGLSTTERLKLDPETRLEILEGDWDVAIGNVETLSSDLTELKTALKDLKGDLEARVGGMGDVLGERVSNHMMGTRSISTRISKLESKVRNFEQSLGADALEKETVISVAENGAQIDRLTNDLRELSGRVESKVSFDDLKQQISNVSKESVVRQTKHFKNMSNRIKGVEAHLVDLSVGDTASSESRAASYLGSFRKDVKDLENIVASSTLERQTRLTTLEKSTATLEKSTNDLWKYLGKESASRTEFMETALKELRDEFLGSEFAAIKTLLKNETIRDMLKDTEVKGFIETFKKGKD